jgi:hypothetical protein
VVEGSVRVRKAWWARLGVLPSRVVRIILRESVEVREIGVERGEAGDSLLAG